MKKFLIYLVCLLIFFSSIGCKPTTTLSELPKTFPMIQQGSPAADWGREKLSLMPSYDPKITDSFQVDLRQFDLSDLDLSGLSKDLKFASFDTQTSWPEKQRMPSDFDWQRIMELGKNPGLGIRKLHQAGITGNGVGIAIIDQPLLVEHQEYVDQLRFYEVAEGTSPGWTSMASMHGSAVASIAVGKSVGVAPGADLYFIGTSNCNNTGTYEGNDFGCLAQSVRRILEINDLLPEDRKIRVLSMAIGWGPDSLGYEEITAATNNAKKAGMLVICSSVEEVHGFKFHGLGRDSYADPDKFESFEPGMFWAERFFLGNNYSDRLMIPMDSRTTAGPGGVNNYAFYREGGWSWSIPYIAGVYALAAQSQPDITPEEFWQLTMQTGQTIHITHEDKVYDLGPILDPVALINQLQYK